MTGRVPAECRFFARPRLNRQPRRKKKGGRNNRPPRAGSNCCRRLKSMPDIIGVGVQCPRQNVLERHHNMSRPRASAIGIY